MASKVPYSENVLESSFSTVTSGGHWFNFTSSSVEELVPELLERYAYEKIILDAVAWIKSTDSLSLILYFVLVFWVPAWLAVAVTLTFYFAWYNFKSVFVQPSLTPVLKLLNHDAVLLVLAAVVLSLLGIMGYYAGLLFGFLFFFLFKVGLLRLLLQRIDNNRSRQQLPLNDLALKMVLVRYAERENLQPAGDGNLKKNLQKAFIETKSRQKK